MGSSIPRVHLDRGDGTPWCFVKGKSMQLGSDAEANCELCFKHRETAPGPNQILYCSACDTKKPGSEFGSHKTRATGKQTECKVCFRAKRRVAAKLNRAKVVADAKRFRHKNPEPSRRNSRRRNENFPKAVYAKGAVKQALKMERLRRGPCEVCGATYAHAHHDDYDQPLSVRWLCPVHHAEWHAANGPGANIEGEPVKLKRIAGPRGPYRKGA